MTKLGKLDLSHDQQNLKLKPTFELFQHLQKYLVPINN